VSQETANRTFDELARALASGSISRGKALRLMGGLLVGGALASVPGVAWAGDDRCPEGQTRCGDRCVNLKTNERHCGSCRNRCRSTQTCCGGRCVNLQRNERHCGSCFNRCDEGEQCVDGMCAVACISDGNGPCADPSECCSGNCDSSSGFCLPPTGPNRVQCTCSNSTVFSCTSVDCDSAESLISEVCIPLCAVNGGSFFGLGCIRNHADCA
jgi:hypothetical protein